MRKIISVLVAVLCLGMASACVKKSGQQSVVSSQQSVASGQALTVIVMDTTQALIDGAQVKIGKQTFTTSYDGRVVLKPEQVNGAKSLTVSCDGFKDKKVSVDGSMLIVRLEGKKTRGGRDEMYYSHGTRGKGTMLYKTMTVGAAAPMMDDGVVMAEEAAAVRPSMAGGAMPNSNVSAGKLTAGEVNDFAKWALWPDILDKSHKQFIGTWRIEPRERYTVQVTDKHGYPIVNYPVSLTDAKGNTLFQTMTDNTGRAELWNGLLSEPVKDVRVEGVQELKRDGINSIEVDEPCDAPDGADVLFVFDATGSMGDELRYLQEEMKDVIARAKQATGGLNIRTGAVVYRDHGDEYITRISRLTEDIKTTQNFIDKQEANGGGDFPEAVPEALMAAINSAGWDENTRARIAFLILDAPCHQDSATLALLHDQILNAAAQGIRIVPVVCSSMDKAGEFLMRSMALATNGTSFFLTDDSGIGNPHLKPTTDSLKVEHLNDMLVRTIVEFSYMPDCVKGQWHEEEIENIREEFIPNPFSAQELEADPTIPHGPTTLYLLDVSGKLIHVYNGVLEEAGDRQLSSLGLTLSTGVYFVKAFYDGEWHTKKILVH